jgi:hypothetical protein
MFCCFRLFNDSIKPRTENFKQCQFSSFKNESHPTFFLKSIDPTNLFNLKLNSPNCFGPFKYLLSIHGSAKLESIV